MSLYYTMFDSTYILVIIGAVICLAASSRVKSTFAKYSKVRSARGMTGREAAERILSSQGLGDVQVMHVSGSLTDHYDPRTRTVNLSDATYNQNSVAAVGVAAHECGHAIQHQQAYGPLTIRTAIVPLANFGSMAAWPLIILGLFIGGSSSSLFINLGILAFSLSVLFQVVTLPVEFNASSRAVRLLGDTGILGQDELKGTKAVLSAAALTYVASAAASLLQLLRLLMIASRRD
ncbi:MAG: zinc metallopeptidase [Eubacteriales bacterium]